MAADYDKLFRPHEGMEAPDDMAAQPFFDPSASFPPAPASANLPKPNGHTYTTHPDSRIFLPSWHTTTAALPPAPSPPAIGPTHTLLMPRRRRTRAAELAHRIKRERAHVTQRNKPPPSGGDTAVAEGFEPPDGVSRLSLSRRVH